jgi:hypothetical protein
VKRSSIFSKGRRWSNADINEQYARLLRLGRLLKTIAASLAVSGTEAREKRVAGAEDGLPQAAVTAPLPLARRSGSHPRPL